MPALLLAVAILALGAPAAESTPVAKTEAERAQLGRVFPEPINSTDFINHGPRNAPEEFAPAWRLLQQLYPGYVDFTSIDRELGDPGAMSLGPDGKAAWDPQDTKDGSPFYVAKVTDESVPDRDKSYVLLLNAHPAEPCGLEGSPRFLEDLLIWRATDPGHLLDDGTGLYGKPHVVTVEQLLKRVKIYFVSTSPDGWTAGDGPTNWPSNLNYAGANENRVAYQDGWVVPPDKTLEKNGYAVLKQPEGQAVSRYLRSVRARELGGRPFAVANDQHGPLPVGAILLHDQGNDPAKVDRLQDYGARLKQKMDGVFTRYFTQTGKDAHELLASQAGSVRDVLLRYYQGEVGPFGEKAAFITLKWADYASVWDHLDYTVTGSWGGWAGSKAGLGADSISFETACNAQGYWDPAEFQLYVDNVRAADETGAVYAAARARGSDVVNSYDLGGPVGFLEPGDRVTDRDGNPSPPPAGHPGSPMLAQIEQAPYDVANTDYFRDLRRIVTNPVVKVPRKRLASAAGRVATLAVADTTKADATTLRRFIEAGGNLLLTDGALELLPALVGVPASAVARGFAYVGYSDLDRSHPWTKGLYPRARQMFDPVGLGYPLLMERDQYWPCDVTCEESPTQNSAPIWSVDRAAWEAKGGRTIGTADPPADRKAGGEGTATTKTTIGTLPVGKGRVVIFGALLPQPTEEYPHWFGLDAYTVSVPAQQLLLRALTWERTGLKPLAARDCTSRLRFKLRLRDPRGAERLVSARVKVGGRRVRVVRRRGRLLAMIDLHGKEGRRVRVRISARTSRGRTLRTVKTYRPCGP